jgi:putative effector of murein hydrolase
MNELLTTVFWSAVTLAVFFGWRQIFLFLKHPLLHPILWSCFFWRSADIQ